MVKQGRLRLKSIVFVVLVVLETTLLSACTGSTGTGNTPNSTPVNKLGTYTSPSWWNGTTCDKAHYPEAYSLLGYNSDGTPKTWRGIQVCGPLPGKTSNHIDAFSANGQGADQYEFMCPDLIARYLLTAYGLTSQVADGWQIVNVYTGLPNSPFHKVANDGSVHFAPAEGDVLSYGTDDPGHTSIVTGSSVNGSGNGTINVIEQNVEASGTATLTMSNWIIQHDANHIGTVASWMTTLPVSSQQQTPTPTQIPAPVPTPTQTPNFGPFVGTWFAHSDTMIIKADGTATYTGRVFIWCTDDPRPPCDTNEPIMGGLNAQITFTSVSGNTASGSITGGTGLRDFHGNIIPVGSNISVTLNPDNDTLNVSDGSLLCGPTAIKNVVDQGCISNA
jgi:hypothetical protein